MVALLVAGTGMVLIPRDSGTPPPVSFSEAARTDAAKEAAALLEAAQALAEAEGKDAKNPGLGGLVTLLTTHARALMVPEDATGAAATHPTPQATPATKTASVAPATRASLVEELALSGRKRLAAAREADGGIARLLASVGTAQLLHAETLAAQWQLPLPVEPPHGQQDTACFDGSGGDANRGILSLSQPHTEALVGNYRCCACCGSPFTTRSGVRLPGRPEKAGEQCRHRCGKGLEVHVLLLRQAEALTRANCGDVPATTAYYQLPELFAQDPATALAALETSSLPRFGDLVALSTGETRGWAVDGLLAAARRSVAWGASLPALPGLKLDADTLPSLPTPGAVSSRAQASTGG